MSMNHTFAICAYKESPYLEECIQSLLKQTVKSELIMVTSTPNDHIRSIAEKYKIPLYANPGEGGIAQDWNFGYEMAKTRYVTLAHQDDVYFPEYARTILKALRREKHPLIAFSDYWELRNGEFVKENRLLNIKRLMLTPLRFRPFFSSVWVRRRILSVGSAICCPSVTMVKENIEGQVFAVHFRSNVDWEAWTALTRKKGQFVYCPEPLMAHRIHEDSETSAIIGDNRRGQEDYEMFRQFWPAPIARRLAGIYGKSEGSNQLKRQ